MEIYVIQHVLGEKPGLVIGDGVILEWPYEARKPTSKIYKTWATQYEEYLESIKYKKMRAAEYPSVQDQLDTLYHTGVEGLRAQLKIVKDKYPKPE